MLVTASYRILVVISMGIGIIAIIVKLMQTHLQTGSAENGLAHCVAGWLADRRVILLLPALVASSVPARPPVCRAELSRAYQIYVRQYIQETNTKSLSLNLILYSAHEDQTRLLDWIALDCFGFDSIGL